MYHQMYCFNIFNLIRYFCNQIFCIILFVSNVLYRIFYINWNKSFESVESIFCIVLRSDTLDCFWSKFGSSPEHLGMNNSNLWFLLRFFFWKSRILFPGFRRCRRRELFFPDVVLRRAERSRLPEDASHRVRELQQETT